MLQNTPSDINHHPALQVSRHRELTKELHDLQQSSGMDTVWIGCLTTLKGPEVALMESGKLAQHGFTQQNFRRFTETFLTGDGYTYSADPVSKAMFNQTLPLFWSLDDQHPATLFADQSEDSRVRINNRIQLDQVWGVTIPVHLPTHAMLLITLSSATTGQDRIFLQGALSVKQGDLLMQAHKLARLCTEKLKWDRTTKSNGKNVLSPRERDCLSLARRGLTAAGIAEEINLQPETCRSYLKSAYRKLDVQNRTEAVIRAMELGEI